MQSQVELGLSSPTGSDSSFDTPPWYLKALEGGASGAVCGACALLFAALITELGNVLVHHTNPSIQNLHLDSLALSAVVGGAFVGGVLGCLQGPCIGRSAI